MHVMFCAENSLTSYSTTNFTSLSKNKAGLPTRQSELLPLTRGPVGVLKTSDLMRGN